jgi:flagellar hook assembly protein FlgD
MTFALVHRQLSDLTRQISKLDAKDLIGKENLIAKSESTLNETYLKSVERSNLSQTVIMAFVEIKLSSLRLSIRYQQAKISNVDHDSW